MLARNIITVAFFDLQLVTSNFKKIADWIIEQSINKKNEPTIITHINASNYYYLQKNISIRENLKNKSYLLFDGIGMKIGYFFFYHKLLPDLNGTDLFPLVMNKVSNKKIRIFCLGAKDGIIDDAVQNIKKQYPNIKIVGYHNGYFNSGDTEKVISYINKSKAQLLLIGMGFLKQEEFALKCQRRLNVSLIWNLGGLFDFVSGAKPRAPLVIRKMRLEWLFRLFLEPRRMWHRNIIAMPLFFLNLIKNKYVLNI